MSAHPEEEVSNEVAQVCESAGEALVEFALCNLALASHEIDQPSSARSENTSSDGGVAERAVSVELELAPGISRESAVAKAQELKRRARVRYRTAALDALRRASVLLPPKRRATALLPLAARWSPIWAL
jgi:hypothetical protein